MKAKRTSDDTLAPAANGYAPTDVPIADLKPHPRNYRQHPDDQLAQIEQSLREHGFYRNVVVANDLTILAGHGIVQAAKRLGFTAVPVVKLPVEPFSPKALKVLVGDNELGHLGVRDDRELSELLKEIQGLDLDGLLGTGYDEMMLANLAFVSRPEQEIGSFDEAAHWAGMPEHTPQATGVKLMLTFETPELRTEFCRDHGLKDGKAGTIASWWPPKAREDLTSVFVAADPSGVADEADGGGA